MDQTPDFSFGRFTRMQNPFLVVLQMTGIRAGLVRYHQWRMRVALALIKRSGTETSMPIWCSSRFRRHQRALLRLGFLVEREFALARRVIRGPQLYRAFCTLIRARFPDGNWSCAASGTRIIVTAPASQIPEWELFVHEYDLQVA